MVADSGHIEETETTRAAALRWKASWETNWAAGTLHEVLPLYTDDTVFRAFPHREADVGHAAMGVTFDTFQSAATELQCWFREPMVTGRRASIEWWATWMEDGVGMSMAGHTALCFDADGLVTESRDYWNAVDGATTPYEGW